MSKLSSIFVSVTLLLLTSISAIAFSPHREVEGDLETWCNEANQNWDDATGTCTISEDATAAILTNTSLEVLAGQTLKIFGILENPGYGTVDNFGAIENYGTFNAPGLGTYRNFEKSTFNNYGTYLAGGPIQNFGTIMNQGTIEFSNGLLNASYSEESDDAIVTNFGVITFTEYSHLGNYSVIENYGIWHTYSIEDFHNEHDCSIWNVAGATFYIHGQLENYYTCTFTNDGTTYIYGTFFNFGTFMNHGVIYLSGALIDDGTFVNNGDVIALTVYVPILYTDLPPQS